MIQETIGLAITTWCVWYARSVPESSIDARIEAQHIKLITSKVSGETYSQSCSERAGAFNATRNDILILDMLEFVK